MKLHKQNPVLGLNVELGGQQALIADVPIGEGLIAHPVGQVHY